MNFSTPSLVAAIRHAQSSTRTSYSANTAERPLVTALTEHAKHTTAKFSQLRTDPADVVSIAYERILKTKSPFRGTTEAQAQGYLRSICANLLRDQCRKSKALPAMISLTPALEDSLMDPHDRINSEQVPTALVPEYEQLFRSQKLPPALTFAAANSYGLIPGSPTHALDDGRLSRTLGIKRNALQARRKRFRAGIAQTLSHPSLTPREQALLQALLATIAGRQQNARD